MKCNGYVIDSDYDRKLMYPGTVSPEHFQFLISLSRMRSKKAVDALEAFLVKGLSRKDIFETYKISPGYFSLKLSQIRCCNKMVFEMLSFYTG
ncbi:transcriptional regulator [Salmonella enterica]|nr:transcriptional regulator [Salmonella enterica]EEM7113394.1 transcriptional regulator [Salmonella enterica subsp. enterica serovar Poona]HBI5523973.1 transcriptional regulator [Salmonella enterica subsp. enterica serovar Welikade]EAS9893727.1 transcriptional regulator [Salmonella enterica]EEG2848778.1 transcriptional regulator [Salmonella enterica]